MEQMIAAGFIGMMITLVGRLLWDAVRGNNRSCPRLTRVEENTSIVNERLAVIEIEIKMILKKLDLNGG